MVLANPTHAAYTKPRACIHSHRHSWCLLSATLLDHQHIFTHTHTHTNTHIQFTSSPDHQGRMLRLAHSSTAKTPAQCTA